MTTYKIKKEFTIQRQEGDHASVIFVVPDILSLNGRTATFKVANSQRKIILSKTVGKGLTISGQQISIPLLPADTKGHSGSHKWELELSSPEIITIGKGSFIITPEIIK